MSQKLVARNLLKFSRYLSFLIFGDLRVKFRIITSLKFNFEQKYPRNDKKYTHSKCTRHFFFLDLKDAKEGLLMGKQGGTMFRVLISLHLSV